MLDPNPTVIQPGPTGHTSRTPLILIHDGSGLVSSYFWLGPLGRKVIGIFNPRFESGGNWAGGLREMATVYTGLIESVVPRGKVLLGGWSLGGLIALEIARRLAQDANITVAGLILIDSVYPRATGIDPTNLYDADVSALNGTNVALQLKVQQAAKHARQMIRDWDPPSWRTRMPFDQSSHGNIAKEESAVAAQDHCPDGSIGSAERPPFPSSPPPAILLKASQYVPNQDVTTEGKLATVDVSRQTKRLGWEEYEHPFIRVAFDIQGHHFSVFAPDKVQQLTTKISMACAMLDARD